MLFRFALKSLRDRRPSGDPVKRPAQRVNAERSRRARWLAGIVVLLVVGGASFPSGADLKDEIEKLREEQAEVKKQREAKAEQVDAATAEANELAEALAAMNSKVSQQEETLASAEQQLVDAERRFAQAAQAVVNKRAEIETLKVRVSNRAVSAFVDQNRGQAPVLGDSEPNKAARMQSLVEAVAFQEVDAAEDLRAAREDLMIEEALADDAAKEAETLRASIEVELQALEETRDAQATLANEAEARLEAQLAEAAVLAERDKEMAGQLDELNEKLARQAALARARNNPAPTNQTNPSFPSADEITKVDVFWVHIDIADDLDAMLKAAAADGIILKGWGYRDHQAQIRLRKAHCGTSNYAIYQKPSSTCRPPTARPGRSMHEQGKAIDFTYNGRTIGTRSSPAFTWRAANAANYGLLNLPSEPWHWSVNGN